MASGKKPLTITHQNDALEVLVRSGKAVPVWINPNYPLFLPAE